MTQFVHETSKRFSTDKEAAVLTYKCNVKVG